MAISRRRLNRQAARLPVALAIALVLIVSQLHAMCHATEFGGDFHHHHGSPCAVQILYEAGKSLSAPIAPAAPSAGFFSGAANYGLSVKIPPREVRYGHHHIRGPPALLS